MSHRFGCGARYLGDIGIFHAFYVAQPEYGLLQRRQFVEQSDDPLVACVHLFYRFSHGQRLYRRGAFVASEGVDGQISDEDEGQWGYRHVQVGMELP